MRARLRRRRPRGRARAGRAPDDPRQRRPLRRLRARRDARRAAAPSSTSSCRRAASSIAPLLASVEPDLVVCMGFPWKIPADALGGAAARLAQRPPVAACRVTAARCRSRGRSASGDEEIGITFHRMDAELDTGADPRAADGDPLGELQPPDDVLSGARPGRRRGARRGAREARRRVTRGRRRRRAASYESFFAEEDVWLDLSRPAAEVHRLVWAWRYAMSAGGTRTARCSSSTASRCACSPRR